MKKFDLQTLEAIRLDATLTGCLHTLDTARALIGPNWDAVTHKLLAHGLIEFPKKGPAVITEKAARFLAICDTPIYKN